MKTSLRKLLSLTLALLMVVSSFQGMFVFEAGAEEAPTGTNSSSTEENVATVGEEASAESGEETPEATSESGSELVNLYYPLMQYRRPSSTCIEYIEGGVGSTSTSDYVVARSGRAASRAIKVNAGDTLYFAAYPRGGKDIVFKYDSTGAFLGSFSGSAPWGDLDMSVSPSASPVVIESFTYNEKSMAVHSYVIPEGVSYVALMADIENSETLFMTLNQPFTAADYMEYWANFDYDANTGLEYNADSILNGKNILFLGDSAMYGLADLLAPTTGKSIAGRIELMTGANTYNLAVGGFSGDSNKDQVGVGYIKGSGTNSVADQFASRDTSVNYDIVVLWAGIWDLRNGTEYGGGDQTTTAAAVYSTVDTIKAALPGVKIFIINGPLRADNSISSGRQPGFINNIVNTYAADQDVYCIDLINNAELNEKLVIGSSKYMPDGVNFTSDGYDIIAPYIVDKMEKALAPTENLYYHQMMYRRPSITGVNDNVEYRYNRAASRAIPVKEGDVLYFAHYTRTIDIFFKYDAEGNFVGSFDGSNVNNAVVPKQIETFTHNGYSMAVHSWVVPAGVSYVAMMADGENVPYLMITNGKKFTSAEYIAYWESFDADANTGITLNAESNLADKSILFLGDSAMYGLNDHYAPSAAKGIAGRIALATGASVTNLATGGGFTGDSKDVISTGYIVGSSAGNDVASQFAARDTNVEYDAVVLWAGIWDLRNGTEYSGGNETTTAEAVVTTVNTIRSELPSAKIFVINGPIRTDNTISSGRQPAFYSNVATALADIDNVYCIDLANDEDLNDELMVGKSYYIPDGVNPTSDGYDIIYSYVLDDMEEAFVNRDRYDGEFVNLYYPLFQYANPNAIKYVEGSTSAYISTGKWNDSWLGKAVDVAEGDVIYFTNKLEATTVPFVPYDANGAKLADVTVAPVLLESFASGSINVGLYKYEVPAGVAYLVPLIQRYTTHHLIVKNYRFTAEEYNTYWASYNADAKYEKDEDSRLKDKNILFLGDAAMYAYEDAAGLSTGAGIPGRIALITGANVTNLSTGTINWNNAYVYETGYMYGAEANWVANRYEARDKSVEYDAVVLWAGIWDLRGGKNSTLVADEVMRVVGLIRADLPNAKVFVVNGPVRANNANSGGQTGFYEDVKSRIAALGDFNVYCIDLVNNEALNAEINYVASSAMPDGVHFSAEGYDILTPYFLEAMEKGMGVRIDGEFTNLYYPRMLHTRPDVVRDKTVYRREYQISGRVIPVEAGDVIYFLAKSASDSFFQYAADGSALSTTSGSGGYTSLVPVLEVTDHGYFGWLSGYGWNLYSVVIPEGTAYIAPAFTTDNYAKHFITKNRIFTKAEYDAYWATFDPYKDITVDEESVLNGKNILFLGDAVMSGVNDYYAPTTGAGIAGRIALMTGASVTNLAEGSFVSRALSSSGFLTGGEGRTVAEQFAKRDTSVNYDAVVLWAGINDLASNGAWSTAVAAKNAIVAIRAELPDAKIFVIGGPKFNTTRDQEALFNTQLKNWIENGTTLDSAYVPSGVYYIDLYNNEELSTALDYTVGNYLPDGIHPTSDGYDILTPYVIDVMEDAYVDRERHDGEAVNLYVPVMRYAKPNTWVKYVDGVTNITDYAIYKVWNSSYLGAPIEVVAGDYIYYTNLIGTADAAFAAYDATGAAVTADLTATQIGSLTIGGKAHGIYRVIIPEGVAYLAPTLSLESLDQLVFKNLVFTAADYAEYFAANKADDKYELDTDSVFNGKEILVLGDATAHGTYDYAGLSTGNGIAGRIELLTGANVTNLAAGGINWNNAYVNETGYIKTTNPVSNQFANRDTSVEYDYVILWAGIWDLQSGRDWGGGNDQDTYEATMAAIELVRSELPEAQIYVINGPMRKDNSYSKNRQASYYNLVKNACLRLGDDKVYCIDLVNNAELNSEISYIVSAAMPDGVQLSSVGYDIVTPYIIEEMEKGIGYELPENLYYPLMKHRRPNNTVLEYAEGATPSLEVSDSPIYRAYEVTGRAIAVEAGDVIYYLAKAASDLFYKYDANGVGLTSMQTTGEWARPVGTLEPIDHGSFGWIANYEWFLYSVTIPEGVAYIAPAFTTDNINKHFITKNRAFTRAEYDAYWDMFAPYEDVTADEESVLNGKNVLFLGDSAMLGLNDFYAPSTGKSIAGRIALMTGANVTNLAKGDWSSFSFTSVGYKVGGAGNTVAEQFAARDTSVAYDAVVLWAGIYDIIGGNSAWATAVALKDTVVAIRTALPDAKIFVITGPKYGTTADQESLFNTQIKTWLDGENTLSSVWVPDDVYCIDLYNNEALANELMYMTSKYLVDGINPSSDGYDIITPYVIEAIEDAYVDHERHDGEAKNLFVPIIQYANHNGFVKYVEGATTVLNYASAGVWNGSLMGAHFEVAAGDYIYYTNAVEVTVPAFTAYDATGASVSVELNPVKLAGFTAGGVEHGIYRVIIPEGVTYVLPMLSNKIRNQLVFKNREFTVADYNEYWAAYDADESYELDADSIFNGKNILFLGDANMVGAYDYAGLSTGRGIAGRIALMTGANVYNHAIGDFDGKNVLPETGGYILGSNENKHVLGQFDSRDKSIDYDVVVLWDGNRDLMNGTTWGGGNATTTYAATVEAIKAIKAELPDAKVYVITGPVLMENAQSKNQQLAYYEKVKAGCFAMANEGVYCIDLVNNEALNAEISYIVSTAIPDGYRLSSIGYDIITPYVIEAMEEGFDYTLPENLYYPLMKHRRPNNNVLEYAEGATPSLDVSDNPIYRAYEITSRAIAVEPGDVIYYLAKSASDQFYKYDANGVGLTTMASTGEWANPNRTLEVTNLGSWGWFNRYDGWGNEWFLCSVTIPEAAEGEAQIAYIVPSFTTDAGNNHFITKNRMFTKEEYTAYWTAFDPYKDVTVDEDSNLAGKNVLFLGDSVMVGVNDYYAPTTGRGLAGRIALMTGANVTNLAKGDWSSFGFTSVGYKVGGEGNTVAEQFASRDTSVAYDAVVLWAGVYDVIGGNGAWSTAVAVKDTVVAIRAALPDAKIFVIGGPKYGTTADQETLFNTHLKNWFDGNSTLGDIKVPANTYYIDLYTNETLANELMYMTSKYLPDGINPTGDGYDIITPYVLEVLEEIMDPNYVPEPPETETETETEPEPEPEPETPLENLYYPLMKHRRPNTSRIEYADGAETSTTLDDTVIYREYRFAGRAFPVKPGDVIYYTGTGTDDIWFRYDENGIGLSEATTGAYGVLTAVLTATQGEQLFSVNGTKFYLCSVVVPEGTYYMAPIITTDNGTKHFISKNRSFTKAEYDAYWESFNTDANITKTPNSNLAGADILFLGDGTMAGVNDYYAPATGKGIPGRIALGTGANVYNLASGDFDGFSNADTGFLLGTTVAMQYAERNKEITYDAVVIWAGIHENRYGGERNNDNTFAAFKEIAETIMADLPDAKLFVITGPKRDANSTADELQPGLRNRIFNWCETTDNAYCIDLYNNAELAEELMYTTSKYLPDGINPTSDGYDIIYPYVLEVMEKEMEHKHDTDKVFFLDDSVYFEFDVCDVCADWPAKVGKSISQIVRNKLEDINDGYGTLTVGETKNYWFSTDMAINKLTKDGVVLSIAGNELLTLEDGVLKAGDTAIATISAVDTYQIAIEFTEKTEGVAYELYVNGSKITKGALNSAFAITLGDPAFGSYVRFINNKAVVLANTNAPVVPEYTKDAALKTCYHVAEDFADAKLLNGKLVFDCKLCGERAYIATAETTLEEAIANRTAKFNDKVTVFELNTLEIDTLGVEVLLLGLDRGENSDRLGLLYADANGNLFIKNASGENVALTTFAGEAISILGGSKQISVVYDDQRKTVRYYVNENVAYAGGVVAVNLAIENAAFADIEGEDKIVISDAVISSDYVVYSSTASSVFKYVGFQENSISGQIRILSGIDAIWYDSVGYEMKMYDADDNLTKTVIKNTKSVYEFVGENDKDVYAGFYGFRYFSPLVISDVNAINHDQYAGYTLVIEPFAKVGDVSYYGETVTILITTGGYRILKDVEIRIATGNLGDFTGNTNPYTAPAVQQATLASLNFDIMGTQEDRNTVKDSSELPGDVIYPADYDVERYIGGDYNYKAYLSTYTLNDTKAIMYDFAKYGLDKESSTAPGHMISEFISHHYFYYTNIVVNDITIHFINIHVDWRDVETRCAQFENILRYIDEQGFEYVIILGDFNPDNCVATVADDGTISYVGLGNSSTHEDELKMFTNRPAGKLGFVPVNAGTSKYGTFNTILDPTSSSKDINPSACDNILVSENLKVKSVEKIAVDWMNDHAFIVADIVIPANKSALADGPELSENGVDALLGISRPGESMEIPVSEDAFIYNGSSVFDSSSRKGKNYGSSGVIELYDPTGTYLHRVGYVKFDVSSLVGVEFGSVFAEFNVSGFENNYDDGKIDLYGATNSWSESTLTYNKRGDVTQGELLSSVITSGAGVIRFDVTDYVRAAIDNGETIVSFMLENDNSMGEHEFKLDSKEGSGKAPVLKANTGKSFSTYINYTGDASENPWQVAMDTVTSWNEKWATLKEQDASSELLDYNKYGEFTDSVEAATLSSGRDNYVAQSTRLLSTLNNYTYNANESDLYNQYGGYTANGTIAEATGYYYTTYIDGRWWTVDPEGYPFYRTAMVEVAGGVSPKQKANVLAKHGTLEAWAESATARLSELGFNSTGAWSDMETLSAVATPLAQTNLLNVLTDYTRKTGVNITTGGSVELVGGIMPVFDPEFAKFSDEKVASVVSAYVDDPNVYGWMSDNELPDTYLMLDRSLASDYTDAKYFYTYATAWTFMYLKTGKSTVSLSDVTDELRAEYKAMVYDKYFQVVKASLAKYDTNHQYMGCRFLPANYKCEEVMRVAGQYCDVISINYYGVWTPDATSIYNMQKWSGKPFIVTEWYAMGDDADEALTNTSGAGFIVATQAERAKFYENYALGLLEFDGCVGFDWFKMWDNDPTDTVGNASDTSNVDGNKGIYSTSYEEYTALVESMSLINNNKHSLIAFFDGRK